MNNALFINQKQNGFTVEVAHSDTPLFTGDTQEEAIAWAKKNQHDAPLHVARVRDLGDKRKPDHWRQV
jgi:hypothetical protein